MDNSIVLTGIAIGIGLTVILFAYGLWKTTRDFAERYQSMVLDTTRAKLSDMFIFLDTRVLAKISMGAAVVVPVVLLILTHNPLMAVLGVIATLFGPKFIHKRLREKRRKTLIRQLPDALDALVGALRSGMSLQQAFGLLADQLPVPTNQEFGLVVRKLRIGVSMDDVLSELESRIESQEYTMFCTSMRISREVGGNLTEALERLAETMRRKLAMEDKIDALTSQGKMQGLIVGCLPLFLMFALNKMEPESMAPLFNTWLGYGVLVVIGILEFIGFVLIKKIVTIDV